MDNDKKAYSRYHEANTKYFNCPKLNILRVVNLDCVDRRTYLRVSTDSTSWLRSWRVVGRLVLPRWGGTSSEAARTKLSDICGNEKACEKVTSSNLTNSYIGIYKKEDLDQCPVTRFGAWLGAPEEFGITSPVDDEKRLDKVWQHFIPCY